MSFKPYDGSPVHSLSGVLQVTYGKSAVSLSDSLSAVLLPERGKGQLFIEIGEDADAGFIRCTVGEIGHNIVRRWTKATCCGLLGALRQVCASRAVPGENFSVSFCGERSFLIDARPKAESPRRHKSARHDEPRPRLPLYVKNHRESEAGIAGQDSQTAPARPIVPPMPFVGEQHLPEPWKDFRVGDSPEAISISVEELPEESDNAAIDTMLAGELAETAISLGLVSPSTSEPKQEETDTPAEEKPKPGAKALEETRELYRKIFDYHQTHQTESTTDHFGIEVAELGRAIKMFRTDSSGSPPSGSDLAIADFYMRNSLAATRDKYKLLDKQLKAIVLRSGRNVRSAQDEMLLVSLLRSPAQLEQKAPEAEEPKPKDEPKPAIQEEETEPFISVDPKDLKPAEFIAAFRAIAEGAMAHELRLRFRLDKDGVRWIRDTYSEMFVEFQSKNLQFKKNDFIQDWLRKLTASSNKRP